jgi:F-type H+-transporting ATPase subunit gamma
MQTLESLNKKIKTAQDLLSVVKTMKSLAAVSIRQYERAVASLDEYVGIVDMGWQVLFHYGRAVPWKTRSNTAVCLVMGSDQGMCGQFNEVLVSHAIESVEALGKKGLDVSLWCVGEKIKGALTDMGYELGEQFSLPGSLSGIEARVQVLLQRIDAWRSGRGTESFYVCHNVLSSGGTGYDQVFRRLLPLDRVWAEKYTSRKWPGRCLPLMGLMQEQMFGHLLRQHLFVALFRAFAQSLASENAARLMAMQAAEKNILETKEDLLSLFREVRQTGITNELLDIVSGFEALSEEMLAV